MVHPLIKREIEEQLNRLPVEMQRRVLNFALALVASEPKGVPGASLLRFAGSISKEDCDLMTKAIEEDCERVNEENDID